MLTKDQALATAEAALAAARAAGAEEADVILIGEASQSVTIRMGALEDATRSETGELGLRVFVGRRSAQVSTSDLSHGQLAAAAERAVTMARVAPEDPYAGLAPADLLAPTPVPELDLFDPLAEDVDPGQLRAMAEAAEGAALAVAGVTSSEGATAAVGKAILAFATSHGFAGVQKSSSFSISAVAIAGKEQARQQDLDWSEARHLADLDDPQAIGASAGARAVARLDPVRLPTGRMSVLFDRRVAASLLGHLASALSGPAWARGTSFLRGREGERLFRPRIHVVDDPLLPRGRRSRPFDGEGLPTRRTLLVEDGVLGAPLCDSASARQLGRAPTGHASRGVGSAPGVATSNLWLEAGTCTVAELMADIRLGFLVTELIGMGVNGLTGDYSRGAAGFAIRDGAIAEPVTEMTVAGNLLDMFKALVPADDLLFRRAANSPTVRIDEMMVAGA
ncbi:TldD/PmbA family protein [Thermaurantiacus sp.]